MSTCLNIDPMSDCLARRDSIMVVHPVVVRITQVRFLLVAYDFLFDFLRETPTMSNICYGCHSSCLIASIHRTIHVRTELMFECDLSFFSLIFVQQASSKQELRWRAWWTATLACDHTSMWSIRKSIHHVEHVHFFSSSTVRECCL
jgi:hypothetical protein